LAAAAAAAADRPVRGAAESSSSSSRPDDAAAAVIETFPFHTATVEACCRALGCSTTAVRTHGLSTAQATERLERYGPNQLSEKQRVTLWQRLWQQLANVLVIILIIVAIIAIVRALTSTSSQDRITNWIQAALIVLVIV